MKHALLILCIATAARAERPLLTCMKPSYHGQGTACGTRYDKRGNQVAINRGKEYCGDTLWIYRGALSVRVIVGTRTNSEKDRLPYLKIDGPAWIETALGARGKCRVDSVRIKHYGKVETYK